MARDSGGRAQVNDPLVAEDIATKGYVDANAGGGGGIKVYADVTEMLMVRTAEVGYLHVDNIAEAFPFLATNSPPGSPWKSTGSGDMVITTSVGQQVGSPDLFTVVQTVTLAEEDNRELSPAQRIFNFSATDGLDHLDKKFALSPALPPAVLNYVPIGALFGAYTERQATDGPSPLTIAMRDGDGNIRVTFPYYDDSAATKQYVDQRERIYRAVKTITADYTTVYEDSGTLILVDSPTPVVVSVDYGGSFYTGSVIDFVQMGAGTVSFVPVNFAILTGDTSTGRQFDKVSLTKIEGAGGWLLTEADTGDSATKAYVDSAIAGAVTALRAELGLP